MYIICRAQSSLLAYANDSASVYLIRRYIVIEPLINMHHPAYAEFGITDCSCRSSFFNPENQSKLSLVCSMCNILRDDVCIYTRQQGRLYT